MNPQPKVSVIIPVYNTEKYLRQCLDSVVNQTLRDIEIICVDDGSTDGSPAILSDYAEKDNRIKVFTYHENKSASQARKDGVLSATGKYIMFLDGDDFLALTACEYLSERMEALDVDVLQFGTYVEATAETRKQQVAWFENFAKPYEERLLDEKVFNGCFRDGLYGFTIWNKIYKSDLCKAAFHLVADGAFPKAQDLYAYFIISWLAKSYYGIPNKFYHYGYGRGITGGSTVMPRSTFVRYCSQSKVAEKCKEFLVGQDAWAENADTWEKVNNRLISECINVLKNNVSDADAAAGMDVLLSGWTKQEVYRALWKSFKDVIPEIQEKCMGAQRMDADLVQKCMLCGELNIDPSDGAVPPGFSKIIPIVFATNDKYAPYAAVAIESVLENASASNYYRIYILHSGLSEMRVKQLEMVESDQASVKCINIAPIISEYADALYEKGYFSKEMYYRFIIAKILPWYTNVIYLDCDLVVTTDIADIIPKDFGNALIAAARNPSKPASDIHLARDIGINGRNYINSGVLVINVSRWNQEKITEKCFETLNGIEDKRSLWCPDQDILNIVCKDRIHYLDAKWNFLWHMIYGDRAYVDLCKPIVDRVGNGFHILHFASNVKPWSSPELPHAKYFWKYARNSSVYEEILLSGIMNNAEKNNTSKNNTSKNNTVTYDNALAAAARYAELAAASAQEVEALRASWSYRIGHVIVWLPGKIKRAILCGKEHGVVYMLYRILVHLHLADEHSPHAPVSKTLAAQQTAHGTVRRTVSSHKKAQSPKEHFKD